VRGDSGLVHWPSTDPKGIADDRPQLIALHQEAVVAVQATDDLQVMGAGSERRDLLLLAEGKEAIIAQLW
jgi:hypothetical protein